MNSRIFISFVIFLMLIIMASTCEEDTNPEPEQELDYFPTTYYSTWKYQVNFENNSWVHHLQVRGIDAKIDGKTYQEVDVSAANNESYTSGDEFYARKENGNYHFIDYDFIDAATVPEMIFLKDNVPAGTSWGYSFPDDNQDRTINYDFVVKLKGIEKTVGGKTYEDVIWVEQKTYPSASEHDREESILDLYFAKEVGIILQEKTQYLDDLAVTASVELLEYEIR